jgi:hypothetical protein
MTTCCLLCLLSATGRTEPITLTLNDDEQRALYNMIDAATKMQGATGARTAVYFMNKMDEAHRKTEAPKPDANPTGK